MNTFKVSSKVLLLSYFSQIALLEYSSYVLISLHRTLCLNGSYNTYMIDLRWRFVVTFGLAHVLARPSVGWESAGDMGCSLVREYGARVRGNLRI
jgi:hypothetical protein